MRTEKRSDSAAEARLGSWVLTPPFPSRPLSQLGHFAGQAEPAAAKEVAEEALRLSVL